MARAFAITVAVLALFAVPASAKTFSAQSGPTSATITYTKTATTNLTITRNGTALFNGVPHVASCGGNPCAPSGFRGDPPLRVVDLDGDGEPEVIYSAYTGGAHCCSVADSFRLNAAGNGYESLSINFFDPGFALKDLDNDGTPEFVTRDDAFAYRFTAYAFSGLPILVQRYSAGSLTDVTNRFPALIRNDARVWKKRYNRIRRRKDRTQQGAIAAWAADEYRLGKRATVLAFLQSEAERGHLRPKFLVSLDRFLRRRGY